MPCYTPDPRYERGYEAGQKSNCSHHPDDVYEIRRLKDKKSELEAVLCAIFNELEKRGIANEVIASSSREGLIDIMEFWVSHKKDDMARMAQALHKFSIHEQNIIRELLSKNH